MNFIYKFRFALYGGLVSGIFNLILELFNLEFGIIARFLLLVVLSVALFPLVNFLDKKYVYTDKE